MRRFCKQHEVPFSTNDKIEKYIVNQFKLNNDDWDSLVNNLPPVLRIEVIKGSKTKITRGIRWFQEKPDNFIQMIIPKLKLIFLFESDIVYS